MKRLSFDFVNRIHVLVLVQWTCELLPAWLEALRNWCKLSTTVPSSFWKYLFLLGVYITAVSSKRDIGTVICVWKSNLEPSPTCGFQCWAWECQNCWCKNSYLRPFCPKNPLIYFCKNDTVRKNCETVFWQTAIAFNQEFAKWDHRWGRFKSDAGSLRISVLSVGNSGEVLLSSEQKTFF